MKGFLFANLDPAAFEGLTEEEAAELEAARDRQASCIRRFLGSEEGPMNAKKVFRVATARFLTAIDHALWVVTGAGFEQLANEHTKVTLAREEHREQLQTWINGPPRICILAADQQRCGPGGIPFL